LNPPIKKFITSMKKKIAIIIERANIVLGGAERSIFELSSALTARGHHVELLAAKGQTDAKNIHILCGQDQQKRTDFNTFAKAVKAHLAQNQYDIVHSVLPFDFADIYQPRGGTYQETVLRNAASYQNKLLATCKLLTSFTNFRRTRLLKAERNLCKSADGPMILALSEYVRQQFKKHYDLSDDRLRVVANGVRINKQVDLLKADKLRGQILAQLNINESANPVFFLFVANNFRLKGLSPLIRALRIAVDNETDRPAFLLVAGHGRPQKYRLLARKLNVHKRILFLGALRQIQNALSITDVAALPTFYDPASRFILEAIGAEKPVITTKFNGATDLIQSDRHGKVIDSPEDIDSLAEAIGYYTDGENIKEAANAIAEDRLDNTISIRRVAEQLDGVYDDIIQKRS
jgi:UDP-glucose:(heptosyl)LPS alpha-1,3-glucosyltransferase